MIRSIIRSRPETTVSRLLSDQWFTPLRELQETMNSMFGRFFSEAPHWEPGEMRLQPPINMYEEEGNLVVEAILPDLQKGDLDVSATADTLTIKGEVGTRKEIKEEKYYHCEILAGSFLRTLRLPHEVRPDKIKATYKDGILKVVLPHAEEAKTKTFKVNVE